MSWGTASTEPVAVAREERRGQWVSRRQWSDKQKQCTSASAEGALLSRHFLQPKSREGDMSGEEREKGWLYGGNGRKEDVEVKAESLAADDGGPVGGSFHLWWGSPGAASSWREGECAYPSAPSALYLPRCPICTCFLGHGMGQMSASISRGTPIEACRIAASASRSLQFSPATTALGRRGRHADQGQRQQWLTSPASDTGTVVSFVGRTCTYTSIP